MSKTLQELTMHFPSKWDEITIRATKDQFIIKKSDEILNDGLYYFLLLLFKKKILFINKEKLKIFR